MKRILIVLLLSVTAIAQAPHKYVRQDTDPVKREARHKKERDQSKAQFEKEYPNLPANQRAAAEVLLLTRIQRQQALEDEKADMIARSQGLK